MSLIVLTSASGSPGVTTSASGSPGVTTTALGLALGWPRPALLVEADPTGGSAVAAGYLRGAVVPPEAMIDLALAQQSGSVLDALPMVSQVLPGSSTKWVPGARSHEQARTLLSLWEPLAAALRALETTGQDVIVDAGRLGLFGSPEPLVNSADLTLLVTRTDMVSLSGARSWAETLRERFTRAGGAAALGVLLVGQAQPFRAREVSRVLHLPVVTTVAWDPGSAAVLAIGAEPPGAGRVQRLLGRGEWTECALLRSYRGARSAITGRIRVNEQQLQAASGGRRR